MLNETVDNGKIEAIEKLKSAYDKKKLVLFLGAGVSVKNELPLWNKLVLAMYFDMYSKPKRMKSSPFPNYLLCNRRVVSRKAAGAIGNHRAKSSTLLS